MKPSLAERIKSAYALRAGARRGSLFAFADGFTDQEVEDEMASMSAADRQFWSDALNDIAREIYPDEPRERRRLIELADEILAGSNTPPRWDHDLTASMARSDAPARET